MSIVFIKVFKTQAKVIALLVLIFSVWLPSAHAGLVGHWVADDWAGGANNWLDRVSSKIATANGSAAIASGAFGGADGIVFDGTDDFFEVSSAVNPVAGKNAMTVVALFKATQGATGADGNFWQYPGPVNAEGPGAPNDFGISYNAAGEANGFFNQAITLSSTVSLIDGNPHTLMMTWRSVEGGGDEIARLYVDGVLVGTYGPTDAGSGLVNASNVRFGRDNENQRWFRGTIGEIRFYDSVENAASLHAAMSAPEIDVLGNAVSIVSGDATPSTADFTDFGSAASGGGTLLRTFSITNSGSGALTLSGTPKVAVSGTHAADFSVTVQPSSPVAASGSTTFQVLFSPSATGTRSATLTIANDDSDEGAYTLAIQGTGTAAGAQAWTADTGNGNGSGNTTADGLRIRRNGSNIEFSADSGTTWSASTVYSTTTTLTLTGSGANDTFVVDFSGGNPIPSGGVFVTGAGQVTGDKLVVTGGAFGTVTHNLSNATDGNLVLAGLGTVTYTGLEPVDMTGSTITDLIFNLPTGPSVAILEDDGTAANGVSRFRSNPVTFESTDFSNPSGSVTINRGNAADTLTINATPDFTATLTVGGVGAEFSTVTIAGAMTLAADKNLTINSSSTVSFSAATADVILSGTGAASITTARDIALVSGASLETVDGNLTLSANVAGTGTGNFAGINNGGLIQASGTGVVTITGRGGDTGSLQVGIFVQSGGDIIGGSSGTMLLTGTSGTGTAGNANGILVDGAGSTITSGGANVTLVGTSSAGGAGSGNLAVSVAANGLVSAGGSGAVNVTGTSTSTSTGNFQIGVGLGSGGRITSSGGNVTVTGTGGGNGVNGDGHMGVSLVDGGKIDAGGTGSVSVTGTGGSGVAGAGVEHGGIWLGGSAAQITSAGGPITLTGTAGPTGFSFGIETDSGATPTISTPAGGGDITFIADSINLVSGSITVNNAANKITIRQKTNSRLIDFGGATTERVWV